MKKIISFGLFLFLLNISSASAQDFEGQVMLQLGGKQWEDFEIPPPTIIYIKGQKTLTKIVGPFLNYYIYVDIGTGRVVDVNMSKGVGHEATLSDFREAIRADTSKSKDTLPPLIATGDTERIGNLKLNSACYRMIMEHKDAGREVELEIWFTRGLSEPITGFFKNYLESIMIGFFGNDFIGRLRSVFKPFIERGEMPIEVGFRIKGQKELDSKLDFLWFDDVKLDDATFNIPKNIKIEQQH